MPDSIQTLPKQPHPSAGSFEPELPVLPHNAAELNKPAMLHVEEKIAAPPTKAAPKTLHVPSRHEVPPLLAYPYVSDSQNLPADSTALSSSTPADSIPADSLAYSLPAAAIPGEIKEGIILINPASEYRDNQPRKEDSSSWNGMSWIYLALTLLFCICALKFKGNKRFLKVLFSDLTETRMRHNAFDETVRETSLLVLLNIAWIVSAGIILWVFVRFNCSADTYSSFSIPDRQPLGIAICVAVTAIYISVLFLGYAISGNVFTDSKLTRMWLKGAGASNALQTFFLFPIALLLLNYPAWTKGLLIAALAIFLIGKLMFIIKGSRIFFHQISSWLLFLYYLCSLEIVPLILTYVAAVAACAEWL